MYHMLPNIMPPSPRNSVTNLPQEGSYTGSYRGSVNQSALPARVCLR